LQSPDDSTKKNKKVTYRYAILAAVVIVAALSILLLYANASAKPTLRMNIQNVNATDIASVVSGVAYNTLEVNNVTNFASSSSISKSGYTYASVSEFNATPSRNGIYPVLITSVVYVMLNSSEANQIEQSVLYTAKQPSPAVSGRLYNYTTLTPFTYDGKQTSIYGIASIAVLNSSYIPSLNQYPIYEYMATFSYNNYVGFVSTSGYENMSQAYSTSIAKLLFQKLVNSGAV
jgi:hypothetical protein